MALSRFASRVGGGSVFFVRPHYTLMNTSERQTWEQTRSKGRASFVLREGILRHGIPVGAVFGLCWLVMDLFRHRLDAGEAVCIAAMAAALALSIGLLDGIRLWKKRQHQYVSGIDHVA